MSTYEQLKLENQLCFTLYASSKALTKKYKPLLDPLGLTYTQYITMLVIWEYETISSKALGNALYLDSGTLTPLLKRLEGMNLITRQRDSKDERNLLVKLTDKGRALKEDAKEVPIRIFKEIGLDLEDAYRLKQELTRLTQLLNGEE